MEEKINEDLVKTGDLTPREQSGELPKNVSNVYDDKIAKKHARTAAISFFGAVIIFLINLGSNYFFDIFFAALAASILVPISYFSARENLLSDARGIPRLISKIILTAFSLILAAPILSYCFIIVSGMMAGRDQGIFEKSVVCLLILVAFIPIMNLVVIWNESLLKKKFGRAVSLLTLIITFLIIFGVAMFSLGPG